MRRRCEAGLRSSLLLQIQELVVMLKRGMCPYLETILQLSAQCWFVSARGEIRVYSVEGLRFGKSSSYVCNRNGKVSPLFHVLSRKGGDTSAGRAVIGAVTSDAAIERRLLSIGCRVLNSMCTRLCPLSWRAFPRFS